MFISESESDTCTSGDNLPSKVQVTEIESDHTDNENHPSKGRITEIESDQMCLRHSFFFNGLTSQAMDLSWKPVQDQVLVFN